MSGFACYITTGFTMSNGAWELSKDNEARTHTYTHLYTAVQHKYTYINAYTKTHTHTYTTLTHTRTTQTPTAGSIAFFTSAFDFHVLFSLLVAAPFFC